MCACVYMDVHLGEMITLTLSARTHICTVCMTASIGCFSMVGIACCKYELAGASMLSPNTIRAQSRKGSGNQETSRVGRHDVFMQCWLSSSAVYNTTLLRSTLAMLAGLVALELADALLHLLVGVDAEALVLGDAGQLHVLGVELLLHHLLEGAKGEGLGFLEGQAPGKYVSGFAHGVAKLG
jgi:hypothetical protein